MPTFVALLRGINVGKARRIPMAALRVLLGELGYTNVATLLNSGNAVFSAAKGTAAQHAAAISEAIAARLQSKAGKALLGKAGQSATTRNWATVLKLQALLKETAALP